MTEAERIITTPDTPRETPGAPGLSPDVEAVSGSASGAVSEGASEGASEEASGVPSGAGAHVAPGESGDGSQPVDRGPRRIAILIGVAAVAFVLDLLSKIWVVTSLEGHRPIDVLGHYLRLDATRNGGAAFGMGQGMTIVFSAIAVGVIVVIVRLSRRLYSAPWAVALGLLLGGAFGNLTDRIFRAPGGFQGHVVDFVAPVHFAVFNLADSAICCGGALIVLLSFRGIDPDGTRHVEDESPTGKTAD